jgi:hypothetical protein
MNHILIRFSSSNLIIHEKPIQHWQNIKHKQHKTKKLSIKKPIRLICGFPILDKIWPLKWPFD